MADIRIRDLPGTSSPSPSDVIPIDNGTTRQTTIENAVNAGIPVASQVEAEAGAENTKRMTALRTRQAIDSRAVLTIAPGSDISVNSSDPQSPVISYTGPDGTVTSVDMSVPTGMTVGGAPVTSSGTIALSWDSGYQAFTSSEASAISNLGDLASKNQIIAPDDIDAEGTPGSTTFLRGDGEWAVPEGGGDVSGPETSVAGNFAAFDDTTGKIIEDSGVPLTAIPAGGSGGQALLKLSGSDYDTEWASLPGGGDMLASVYDPQSVGADAFARENMTGTQTLATISDAGALAGKDQIEVSDIDATGTADATTYLRGDGSWQTVSGGAGTVTSVGLSAPTGLSVSGSPVTTSGTLALAWTAGYQGYTSSEASKLSGIEAGADVTDATNVAAAGAIMDGDFSADGIMARTAAGTYASRSIGVTASTGLSVSNGNGVSGNPTLAGIDATTTAKGVSEFATAAEFRTGSDAGRSLVVSETWNAAASVTLTNANPVVINLSAMLTLADIVANANRTLDFTNVKEGQHFIIKIGATGATRTITMDSIAELWEGVEEGPYAVTTSQILYVCGFISDGGTVEITSIGRRDA